MFKDILIPMLMGEIPEAAVRTAGAIARRYDAHVAALVGVSMITPNAQAWASYPEGVCVTLRQAAEAAATAMAGRAEARLAREGISHEVRRCTNIWMTTPEMAATSALYADLVVMGRSSAWGEAEHRLFSAQLVAGGRPLLLVPESDSTGGDFDHVVVAWRSSREVARTVHDALPLLQQARLVDILVIDDGADANAGEDLRRHLLMHGVSATVVHRDSGRLSDGDCILEHATQSGAQLIVAGAYSHARALEQVFGGATRTLVEKSKLPLLFSH
jgi:nucleotide-binding universal stress UspA family protein